MNERIEKLALQAKEYADTKYSKLVSTSRWGDCVPGIRELYTEKFAELIVRECAQIVNDNDCEGSIVGDGMLFEHFGVKE